MIAELLSAFWTIGSVLVFFGPLVWWLNRCETLDRGHFLHSVRKDNARPVVRPPSRRQRWTIGLALFVPSALIGATMMNASDGVFAALREAAPF